MAAIYGLEYSCRALCARPSDDNDEGDILNFLVGTCSARHDNQLHALAFDDESEEITSQVYSYPQGAIQALSCNNLDRSMVAVLRESGSYNGHNSPCNKQQTCPPQ
eukprot:m.107074 g.107074  ORF g.107074 m.107074 type:complete len:106 (+) comp15304_c0_seq85:1630-1947(+)